MEGLQEIAQVPIAIDFELLGVQAERGCDPQQAFTRSVTWGISLTHRAIAIHEAEERLGKTSLLVVGTSSMATNLTGWLLYTQPASAS